MNCKKCKSANLKHDDYTLWCGDCGYILSHNPKLWQKRMGIQKRSLSSDENTNGVLNTNTAYPAEK